MHQPSFSRAAASSVETTYLDARHALSRRGQIITWIIAAILLLCCGVGLAAVDALPFVGKPAQRELGAVLKTAEPGEQFAGKATTFSPDGSIVKPEAIAATWDGPAVNLAWTGAEYVRAETSFVGDRIVSPGDRVFRTLNIVNAGPGSAVLSVAVVAAEDLPSGTHNQDLAEDVTLHWDVHGVKGHERFSALISKGRVNVAEISVPKGEEVAVSMGYEMSRAVETSRALGASSTKLEFDVDVKLTGDTAAPVTPQLPVTGAAGILLLLALGLALGLIGLLLLVTRRRRSVCGECDRTIERTDHWVKIHDSQGLRTIQCQDCYDKQSALPIP